MEIMFSQKIRERYQTMKLGVLALGKADNKGSKALRQDRGSVKHKIKKEYKNWEKLKPVKAYNKYFGRFDRPFPILEGLKAVLAGKDMPTISPLVDSMLLSELKHIVLMGMVDADRIDTVLTLDQAQEGETFIKSNGREASLRQGDVVLRDGSHIIYTYLEGLGQKAKVNRNTRNCICFGFFVPGIEEVHVKAALKDVAKLTAKACRAEAGDIEMHAAKEGTEASPGGPQKDIVITPWEVTGNVEKIDYSKLVQEFGTQALDDKLLKKLEKHTGPLHFMLRRGVFFSHRDLDWLLKEYGKKNMFFLYTGRGPSGHTHLGHLVPWILTKWLQDKFGAELWFQMTDDEKFLFSKKGLTLEEANRYAHENALDVIALGFDPKKTFIFSDIDYAKTLYREAIKVAKKLTFSTARAVFGFNHDSNVGQVFFTSMQSVPAFLPSVLKKKKLACLIPHAIDQDPHFRVSRDILPKLGHHKPAAIHNMFLPGLGRGGKMSASNPDTAIFTTDKPSDVKRKIMNSFTGGQGSAAEQRKLGGNPEICPLYAYEYSLLEPDDRKVQRICEDCKTGKLLCGEHKKDLVGKCVKFLEKHQKAREAARKKLDKFMLKD
jgi:tryptophanyl-tRNA synthetase